MTKLTVAFRNFAKTPKSGDIGQFYLNVTCSQNNKEVTW